ncbi:hypothetical protein HXX76_001035 [Chlamydomonas incerta]|uniref:N-acetyltransferase domain-containing protein n=1 Tax=Chlamydomonas incerta TaxID=51695 RepID=A0A836B146_CHLIN|nr:hypothetical protein HXX76_001035 [Chlamydomonas incerta]|eukprot:KAG2444278.1 hypothetical protein HXX76_001035 [Chlamydomonas incerta]
MDTRGSVRLRPLKREDAPVILKLWLDGWDQTFAVWGPMVWRKFARYSCALAAATLLLAAGAYVALRDPATLQAAAAATASASSSPTAASASVVTSLLQPVWAGLKLVAADVALVLPRWALAVAGFLGLLLPAVMTATPRWLQVRLMHPVLMKGVWTYCPDMKDMSDHWVKPEEGREYYVAVGPRELPPADGGAGGAATAATAGEEVLLGGVAIKAGRALRPLPPPDGAGGAAMATGDAADAAGPNADEQQEQQLRQRKPPPPTAAAATATASVAIDGNSKSAAGSSTASAAKPATASAKATSAAANAELPNGFLPGESGYHDNPSPHDVLLFRMVVDPTVRRRGVGRRLVEHVMQRAAAVGGERVLLASSNPEAVRFYEACGFSRDGLKQPGSGSKGKEKEKETGVKEKEEEEKEEKGDGKGKGKGSGEPALLGRAVSRVTVKATGEPVVQAAGKAA